ncbi:MAG: ferrous iron transport protein A [Dethiobacter sp.]|jgi:ferrous iron transport protein A|nr:ferrous iron transport protein A [Dethiobacter sp.]
MKKNPVSLDRLAPGQFGKVICLNAVGVTRRRLMDLGLVVDTVVEALRQSPAGDPTAYQIRGAVIALRSEEAKRILVEAVD